MCGAAGRKSLAQPTSHFDCGAYWYWNESDPVCVKIGPWWTPCPHAMTACLRTGATLTATPLEQAQEALVAAALEFTRFHVYSEFTRFHVYSSDITAAEAALEQAVAAYRAALDGAK